MATKYWIKLYHEILDDPKMGRLPDALFRRTIELFLIAGDFNRGGELPPLADMAWRLRAVEPALYAQMEDLEGLNVLTRNADGGWRVAHFRERQEASPIAERVRRHRAAARIEEYSISEACNESVTDRYTDTDADKESEKDSGADGSGLHEQAADIPTPQRHQGARAMGIRGSELHHLAQHEQAADIPTPQHPQGARAMGIRGSELHHLARHEQAADIPTPQRPQGARAMGSVDLESDAESGSSGMLADGLVKQFVEKTGIPLFTEGEDKWARALERMKQAGVGEADLEQAIDECRQKGLTIASLASVVNPSIIAMSRRRAGRPQEDHRRFLRGEYGEVGR